MRVLRAPMERGSAPLGVVAGGVLLLAMALAAIIRRLGLSPPACSFRAFTGQPCLTCGSSRLAGALLRGDLVGAFLWNPLVFLAGTALAGWAVVSALRWLLRRPALRIQLSRGERITLRIAALAVLLLGWAYLIREGI